MDFSDITKTVNEMHTEMSRIEKEFRTKMQALFADATKSFFVECPSVKAIAWNQYTPYWNDGEECTFSVNDVHFYSGNDKFDVHNYDLQALTYEDLDPVEEIEDDAWVLDFSSYKNGKEETIANIGQAQFDACVAMNNIISHNDDIMRALFGDHTLVVITENETITEEYEHD